MARNAPQKPQPNFRRAMLKVPNLLSTYRLLMAPVLVVLALSELRTLFIVFLCVSFVTDALDGPIARAWNLRSAFGSRLDSIADTSTYAAALVGIFQFEAQALIPHIPMLIVFMGMLILATLLPLIKFHKIASFHLYSSKLNALFLALFILHFLTFGFVSWLYYCVLTFGILASMEIIAVAMLLKEPANDIKGLYWILSRR